MTTCALIPTSQRGRQARETHDIERYLAALFGREDRRAYIEVRYRHGDTHAPPLPRAHRHVRRGAHDRAPGPEQRRLRRRRATPPRRRRRQGRHRPRLDAVGRHRHARRARRPARRAGGAGDPHRIRHPGPPARLLAAAPSRSASPRRRPRTAGSPRSSAPTPAPSRTPRRSCRPPGTYSFKTTPPTPVLRNAARPGAHDTRGSDRRDHRRRPTAADTAPRRSRGPHQDRAATRCAHWTPRTTSASSPARRSAAHARSAARFTTTAPRACTSTSTPRTAGIALAANATATPSTTSPACSGTSTPAARASSSCAPASTTCSSRGRSPRGVMRHSAGRGGEHDRRSDPYMALPPIMFAFVGSTLAGVLGIRRVAAPGMRVATAPLTRGVEHRVGLRAGASARRANQLPFASQPEGYVRRAATARAASLQGCGDHVRPAGGRCGPVVAAGYRPRRPKQIGPGAVLGPATAAVAVAVIAI